MEPLAAVVIVAIIVVYYALRLISLAQATKRDKKRGQDHDS